MISPIQTTPTPAENARENASETSAKVAEKATETKSSGLTFSQFNFPKSLENGIKALGFKEPTPIQAKAIPVIQKGSDLVGLAQTGTGKTAAFGLPMVQFLIANPKKTALILAPTRELAQQIAAFFSSLTKGPSLFPTALLTGGAPMYRQLKALQRNPRVVIATPGRLMDHVRRRTANLSQVGILVLDEADCMLDMGFTAQLAEIQKSLPKERQTLLFSATWDNRMDGLSRTYLKNNPERVTIEDSQKTAPKIEQRVLSTTPSTKDEMMLDELNKSQGPVLIFARTKQRTDKVANYLQSFGVSVSRIHGGRSQGQRNLALQQFKDGKIRVLVATDIASRGIHISNIAHVYNYDLPQVPEDYVHRIGRTGRAGATGQALSFITGEDRGLWYGIDRILKKNGSEVKGDLPPSRRGDGPSEPAFRRGRGGNSFGGGFGGGRDRRPSGGGFGGRGARFDRGGSDRPRFEGASRAPEARGNFGGPRPERSDRAPKFARPDVSRHPAPITGVISGPRISMN